MGKNPGTPAMGFNIVTQQTECQIFNIRAAEMEQMSSIIEGETFNLVAAAEPARSILPLEKEIAFLQMKGCA